MKSMSLTRRGFVRGLAGGAVLGGLGGGSSVLAAGAPLLKFGMITDLHYADIVPSGSRFYRDSLEKLAVCVAEMNSQQVDFLIELGDFKDQGVDEATTLKYLEDIEGVYARFNGSRYHVLGNHDMDNISKEQFFSRITNTGIESGRSWYSFDNKGWHFVVLDANFLQDGTPYNKGNFNWRQAWVPQIELDWLGADLAATTLPTVVFVHQLLEQDSGNLYVRNAAEVRSVLEGSGRVKAVFQGHHHSGAYALLNGIHYYTLKGAIEGAGVGNNAFATVGLAGNRIVVEGFGKAVSRSMEIATTAEPGGRVGLARRSKAEELG